MIALPEFLKKYSTIPNKFIDDFFSLYDYRTSDNDLIIYFDNLCKWLVMRKDVLKRTLKRTYVKGVDYLITIIRATSKGRPREEIIITPDCMKRMCMLSATKKAEEVRTYFIKIEKLLDKYKQIIIDDLNKKIGIMENNQKPIISPQKGVIYVLKSNLDIENLYKIGRSKKFKNRQNTHNSSHPDNVHISLVFETDNISEVENCLKAVLKSKQYRKRKEFFQIDIDSLKKILDGCETVTLIAKGKKIPKHFDKYYLMLDKK